MNAENYLNQYIFEITLDNILYILSDKYQMTAREVAILLQVSEKNLSKWRTGKYTPKYSDIKTLLLFSQFLRQLFVIDFESELSDLLDRFEQICVEKLLGTTKATDIKHEMMALTINEGLLPDILEEKTGRDFQSLEKIRPFKTKKMQSFYEDLTLANNLDVVLTESSYYVPKFQDLTRKIAVQYRRRFSDNFKNLIEVIDVFINSTDYQNYDFIAELSACSQVTLKNFLKEYIDYRTENRININKISVQNWLAQEIKVSPAQISNWKAGKDFPTMQNLRSLQQLLGFSSETGLIGYRMNKSMCVQQIFNLYALSKNTVIVNDSIKDS